MFPIAALARRATVIVRLVMVGTVLTVLARVDPSSQMIPMLSPGSNLTDDATLRLVEPGVTAALSVVVSGPMIELTGSGRGFGTFCRSNRPLTKS